MKNRFQLKPGQIRGRIDNITLTFLYLGEKRTQIAITLHAKQFFYWIYLAKMPFERTVIKVGIGKTI